jgi:hypothetical protein
MSVLSRLLGLDKHPNQLAQINAASREALALAERALTVSISQLVKDRDFDAFQLRLKADLGTILSVKTTALKDKLIETLLEELK